MSNTTNMDFNSTSIPKFLMAVEDSVPPDGKCIYYNATNPKIILDTYEGIPQTLILNFCGWLVSEVSIWLGVSRN